MPILTLNFAGYGQCRLATDPDPTNERRGVSGYTFALADEPDLDWIIRIQPQSTQPPPPPQPPPVQTRTCVVGRDVDVKVTGGFAGSKPIDDQHPLFGAPIDLWDEPRFQERNYIVTTQTFGVIFPFHFRVQIEGLTIRRDVDFYPGQPVDTPVTEIPQGVLQPYTMSFESNVAECRALLGESGNPSVYRLERLQSLERYKCAPRHTLTQAETSAIDKRISELKIDDPRDRRTAQLVNRSNYNYLLNGPAQVDTGEDRCNGWLNGIWTDHKWKYTDPANPLAPWPCQFWMGSWDADSLTFYMKGTVQIIDPGECAEAVPGLF